MKQPIPLARRCYAEIFGAFWLVFGGCGSAVIASSYPGLGIGFFGVAAAFGLTLFTMACLLGPISGCHLNPAVSLGLVIAKRFPRQELAAYVIAQTFGGIAGAGVLFFIASGRPGFDPTAGFATNGYGIHSPAEYSLLACLLTEIVLTGFFVMVVLGVTGRKLPSGFAPTAIGTALMLVHLIGIPVTNVSVNPARSLATATFAGDWAMAQLWLFWVAPLLGAALAGLTYPALAASPISQSPSTNRRTLGMVNREPTF